MNNFFVTDRKCLTMDKCFVKTYKNLLAFCVTLHKYSGDVNICVTLHKYSGDSNSELVGIRIVNYSGDLKSDHLKSGNN